MAALALMFSRQLSRWLLDDVQYASLIRVLAIAQLGIALLNYMLAVINGFMDVRRLALIQVGGSLLGIVLMVLLSRWLHLYGALLALVLSQLLWLLIGLPSWRRSAYFRSDMLRLRFDREMTLRLAAFSIMTLSSALLPPLVNIAVRDHLAAGFGWQQVGYWQAVSKVSDAYLLFLTTAINIYYLPKLASTQSRAALSFELRNAYRYILPAVLLLAAGIYVLREWVTRLLFSADFASANALYGPQLIGDVIKIASFVLSYLMLAKAMTRLFVVSECVFALSYLLLVYVLSAHYGLVGAVYAFALNYALYLVFNLLVARRYLGGLPAWPLVSILIPAYNHGRFVQRCLDSVLEDAYPAKELVIIDDGSTDDTAERIAEWVAIHCMDIPIEYVQRENRGVTATLNELAARASGEFFRLGASDDYLLAGGLQAQVDYLLAHPCKGAVIGDSIVVDADDAKLHDSGMCDLHGADKRLYRSDDGIRRAIIDQWAVGGPVALIRKSTLETATLWTEGLRIDDWDLFLRLAADNALGFIDVKVCAYRLHGSNLSKTRHVPTRVIHLTEARQVALRRIGLFDEPYRSLLRAQVHYISAKIAFLQRQFGPLALHMLAYLSLRLAARLHLPSMSPQHRVERA
jgi:polysaccharide transporter, PST family